MELIKNLNWRYATKKFDSNKHVSAEDITKLEEVIRLSASSYGFQPYKIFIISQNELRERLRPHTWNQAQVVDASHVFVFCAQVAFTDQEVDEYLLRKSTAQGMPVEKLSGYAEFMKGKMKEKSGEAMEHWTTKQAYIAMSNLLTACAELRIDACPIEGFNPEAYDVELGLKDRGLKTAVLVAVGYRSVDDGNQHLSKVRKSKEVLFERII